MELDYRSIVMCMAVIVAPAAARADTNAEVDAIYERIAGGIRTNDPHMSHKA